MFDLIIIGADPAGISAAYEAQKLGLKYLVIEKDLIGNRIYQYAVGLSKQSAHTLINNFCSTIGDFVVFVKIFSILKLTQKINSAL